jgi:glyoxylase-like metal-dependent hydrolase (beta-lactamase superfamily II)
LKENKNLSILKLPLSLGTNSSELNLSLIIDDSNGLALVDTGMPDSADLILEQVKFLGYETSDIKKIFITHHDIDHVGSLADLKQKTGAEVYAASRERPYIEGYIPFAKAEPERLARMPQLAALFANYQSSQVDHVVQFGDVIDFAGGVRVIGTPGHTPGHTSFYLEPTKTLIAGDALTATDGHLNGPSQGATPNMEQAIQSVKDLVHLDIDTIVCYHGGLVVENTHAQLQTLADSL